MKFLGRTKTLYQMDLFSPTIYLSNNNFLKIKYIHLISLHKFDNYSTFISRKSQLTRLNKI